ncbi:MAG: LysR family transcriptional regulator [Bacteriovoracales bacterium]|nr:LysR family transcriptional regulator [Bacteriovoracales bacterium]
MNFNIYPTSWDLRYFQEIAHTANLSRAAERLGVGQPTLSLSLKRLENNLGAKLFLRRNRGLTLTPAGQRLLQESNRLLFHWESIVSEIKKSKTELVGRYSLGCHPSIAICVLKDILREFYVSFPGIEIQLTHGLSRIVCEGVISGTIDFGIVVNPVRHPDLVIHKLARDEVGFWKMPNSLKDVLIYHPSLIQTQSLLKKIKNKMFFKRSIVSENLEVIASLSGTGTGIAILPGRVAKAIAPQLKRMKNTPIYRDEITLVHRFDMPKTPGSKCIVNFMKSSMSKASGAV